jgi:hypothetical protein
MERAEFKLPERLLGMSDTDMIREATRLWRETWLIAPLKSLLDEGTDAEKSFGRSR